MLSKLFSINNVFNCLIHFGLISLSYLLVSCSAPKAVSRLTDKKGNREQAQTSASGIQLQQCPKVAKVYDSLWKPVISKHCVACHTANGQAGFTRFKLNPVNTNEDFAENLEVLRLVSELKTTDGDSLLVAKPTLKVPHSGGQVLTAGGREVAALEDFISSPVSNEDLDCARNSQHTPELTDPVLADRDLTPTRLLRRASLAIRGKLPSMEEYGKIKKDPTAYPSIVDAMMDESEKSGNLHDRIHINVFRRFLPGLVNEPVTLGNNMLGLGVEVRNRIRDVAKDSHASNPEVSRVWNKTYGNNNKALEPSTGCRKVTDENLKAYTFEFYNSQNGPLLPDYSDCVFEAPLKTAAVEFKRIFQPGFSAAFNSTHPLWHQRRFLASLMTPSIALIRTRDNSNQEDVLGLGTWFLESGEVLPSGTPPRKLIMTDEDSPWKSLDLLSDPAKWLNGNLPDEFKAAFPRKIITYFNGSRAVISRFDFSFAPIYLQLHGLLGLTTNSCGSVSDGVRCSLFERDSAFLEMMRWIPPVDVYPDIYKPGYFSGCVGPGERALLSSRPNGQTSSFWDYISAGQGRPPLDTALFPIRADALDAVPVNPWWDPSRTVYVCPGLAVQTAVTAGVINQPPFFETNPANQASYYKVLSRNRSLSQIRYLKEDPLNPNADEVKSITIGEYALALLQGANGLWINQRGGDVAKFKSEVSPYWQVDVVTQQCATKVFRSPEWLTCVRNTIATSEDFWPPAQSPEKDPSPAILHDFANPGRKYRASVYPYDTIYNPLADCGLNLRLCNPSRSGVAILASLEAHALFFDILKNKKPWRSIVSADYRMSNRVLEWARFYTEVEPEYMIKAQISGALKTKGFAEFRSDYPLRITAGDWGSPDIMSFLDGKTVTPELEWFRFETSPEKLNQNSTLLNRFNNPDTDGVYGRYAVANEGHRFDKEWLNYFSPVTTQPQGAPSVGVLSTSTFLNQIPRDRSRANKILQFATCEGFPPATGSFAAVESEVNLPPRLKVKSGCAECHNKGGVDPMARFFMAYSGSRAAEIDGNINFQGDPINWWYLPTPLDNAKPKGWLPNQPMGLVGFGYVRERTVMAINPNSYYGRNEHGSAIDSWKGVSVSDGLKGLAQVLLEEPKFTACAVKNAWRVALNREPADRESMQVANIVAKLQKIPNYTFQDAIREVVLSPAFRKDY